MEIPELFWNAPIDELKRGYTRVGEDYVCLLCGKKTTQGIVYQLDGNLYDAERFMRIHIEQAHESVFAYLIGLDKRLTGLTDHQNALLKLFYQNKSDAQIQKEMEIGSASTIRNHRFALKERERQAKVFLTMMELLKERDKHAIEPISLLQTAKMVDERYNATVGENEKLLATYFPYGIDGPLKKFPAKEKHKIVVLRALYNRFEAGVIYTEKEVNEILKAADDEDYATIRRYMIEYGFLERKTDCSEYWRGGELRETEEEPMDRKKELIRQYKEMKTEGGVYQVRNKVNQKILVVATPNLKTINGRYAGGFMNKKIQEEYKQFGPDAFVFEVLEVLEQKDEPYYDYKRELKRLEEKWLEKLQPYGERGYN